MLGARSARAERIRFFDMRDAYREYELPNGLVSSPSDFPTQIVTVTVNGRTKRVEDYVAPPDALPDSNARLMRPLAPNDGSFSTRTNWRNSEALLKAGARLEDWDNGRSALWYAACVGNWRVVTVLLRAGAHPRGGLEVSALECTRQARQFELNWRRTILDRGRPTVEDFDKVIALLESAAY